jgi:hypothetical protein
MIIEGVCSRADRRVGQRYYGTGGHRAADLKRELDVRELGN